VEIDAPEASRLTEEVQTVIDKHLRDRVVLLLAGKIEAGDHAGVLVEAGTFRKPAQCTLDGPHLRIEFLVGQTLFVGARQREQASVAAAFERKNVLIDEACNRHNRACGSGLCVPRDEF